MRRRRHAGRLQRRRSRRRRRFAPRSGSSTAWRIWSSAPPTAPGSSPTARPWRTSTGACRAEGGDLAVEIAIDLVVQAGPAAPAGIIELPYFVAISAPDGRLLDRQDFVARVTVPSGARRGGVTETFSQRFVGREGGATGYQVLFGFALPEAEALSQYRRR